VDHILVMADGRMVAFGPKDEVLAKYLRPAAVPGGPAPQPVMPAAPGMAAASMGGTSMAATGTGGPALPLRVVNAPGRTS
jgi:hypothetical protein